MDFSTNNWQLPDFVRSGRRLFFYPGSSIGNFAPDEARAFLRHVTPSAARMAAS